MIVKATHELKAAGFSLIEVLIAAFVLTFGLLGAAQLLSMSMGLDARAQRQSAVVQVARNELERLAALYRHNAATPELTPGEHQAPTWREIKNPLTGAVLERYQVNWLVNDIADPRIDRKLPGLTVQLRLTPIRLASPVSDQPGEQISGQISGQLYYDEMVNVSSVFGR